MNDRDDEMIAEFLAQLKETIRRIEARELRVVDFSVSRETLRVDAGNLDEYRPCDDYEFTLKVINPHLGIGRVERYLRAISPGNY